MQQRRGGLEGRQTEPFLSVITHKVRVNTRPLWPGHPSRVQRSRRRDLFVREAVNASAATGPLAPWDVQRAKPTVRLTKSTMSSMHLRWITFVASVIQIIIRKAGAGEVCKTHFELSGGLLWLVDDLQSSEEEEEIRLSRCYSRILEWRRTWECYFYILETFKKHISLADQ